MQGNRTGEKEMTRREFFTSIPKGFECEVRYYCSTCQEEVLEDDFDTHSELDCDIRTENELGM